MVSPSQVPTIRARLRRTYSVEAELVFVALVLLAWQAIRIPLEGNLEVSLAHADSVLGFERALSVDVEGAVIERVSEAGLTPLLTWLYTNIHLPVLFAFLAAVRLYDPARYPRVRTIFVLSFVPAVFVIGLYPLAPPRWHAAFGLEPGRDHAALVAIPRDGLPGDQVRATVARELDRRAARFLSTVRRDRAAFLVEVADEPAALALAWMTRSQSSGAASGSAKPSPSFAARSRRAGAISTSVTSVPGRRAASRAASAPTVPAPTTAMRSPGPGAPSRAGMNQAGSATPSESTASASQGRPRSPGVTRGGLRRG